MKSFNAEKESSLKIVPIIRLLYLVNAFFRHGECILLLWFQTRAEYILYTFVWSSQKLQAQDRIFTFTKRENCRHSFLLPAIPYIYNCIACTKCCMEKTPAKRIVVTFFSVTPTEDRSSWRNDLQ